MNRALLGGAFGLAGALLGGLALLRKGSSMSGSWSSKPGVVLPDGAAAFMDSLASMLLFPVVVTSGLRTDEEQAVLMWAKELRFRAGSADWSDDLTKRYKDKAQIAKLRAADFEEWPSILRRYREAGHPVSNHQDAPGPDALDLRINGLSEEQRAKLGEACVALGAVVIMESDHLHVKLPAP